MKYSYKYLQRLKVYKVATSQTVICIINLAISPIKLREKMQWANISLVQFGSKITVMVGLEFDIKS